MPDNEETPQTDKGLLKDLRSIEKKVLEDDLSVEQQVQAEYTVAYDHQMGKRQENYARLKLYNNQKRDKDSVGDTTLFTIFQTILATLYSDQLEAMWEGRYRGDEEVADNLNVAYEFDYTESGKDEIDFDWIWDTLFTGRGMVILDEFLRDPKNGIFVPIPEVIDPFSFVRDPRAVSFNGNRLRRGSARFFGRETMMTQDEMMNHPSFFKDTNFKDLSENAGSKSLSSDASEYRDSAQGRENQKMKGEVNLGVNAQYPIIEWFTHRKVGSKVVKVKLWLANERKTLVGAQILKHNWWPAIDRPLYPTAHDWDGTSIPDLTEDKQRHKAVAMNLGIKMMTADLYPMYIYDSSKIKNRGDLNFGFQKFIPSDGDTSTAITPLRKAGANLALVDFIYNSLDVSAQKATATPEIQQGMLSSQQRTLGEINISKTQSDTRYSLAAKVFGRSEKRYAIQWYWQYKDYFAEDIDEKMVRLVGAFGAKWRPLLRKNLIPEIDPDVKITSKIMSRAQQIEERLGMQEFFASAMSYPLTNTQFAFKYLGRKYGLKKDELDRLFPPTVDERDAESENANLSEDKYEKVLREDDHNVHLEVHSRAADTKATFAHIQTHIEALRLKKTNPELFPEDTQVNTAYQEKGMQPKQLPGQPQSQQQGVSPSQAPGMATGDGNA